MISFHRVMVVTRMIATFGNEKKQQLPNGIRGIVKGSISVGMLLKPNPSRESCQSQKGDAPSSASGNVVGDDTHIFANRNPVSGAFN